MPKIKIKLKFRPGWHIEDTAITEKFFGSQYDVHGGGLDLNFPHHEAEIAQMESFFCKKPFFYYQYMELQMVHITKEDYLNLRI